MCTLSWIKESKQTLILFNRDESYSRSPEGPLEERTLGNTRVASPSDGDAGGTWIGINQKGCALALLNHYPKGVSVPENPRSRGLLLSELLDLESPRQLRERLSNTDLDLYPSFRLVAIDDQEVIEARWNRSQLIFNTPEPPLSSSSVDDEAIPMARQTLFRKTVNSPESMLDFHRSHLPEKGAWSTCMHREDARTCSFTRIILTEKAITIEHAHRSPCEGPDEMDQVITLQKSSLP